MSRTPTLVCLGCVPLVHNERTNRYIRWAKEQNRFGEDGAACCPYVNLTECELDTPDPGFIDPITDEVCWYDPDYPESADFLGLWVVDLDGLENDPYHRGTIDAGIDGVHFERARRKGRTLTFDVMLFATSACGMSWGVDWLGKVLRGDFCTHSEINSTASCGTTEIRIRECCPADDHTDDGVRIFPSAATTSGIDRLDGNRRDQCCNIYRRYQFVITTEKADKFGDRVAVCEELLPSEENIDCFDWDSCRTCNTPDTCTCDPTCGDDTCEDDFSTATLLDTCYCDPIERIRSCCCLDETFTGKTERSLIIELFAGESLDPVFMANGARNVEIAVFANPKGLPCPSTEQEYLQLSCAQDACARVLVGRIPAGSLLRLDGRTGEAYIVCGNKLQPVFDIVDGNIKQLVTGCYPLIVCALWDSFHVVSEEAAIAGGDGYNASSLSVYASRRYG